MTCRDRGLEPAPNKVRPYSSLGYLTPAELMKEKDMNDSGPSKPVPELHCPDCNKPMRLRTVLPMSNGLWDLSFECGQCGEVSGVVHKPEDR